MADITDYKSLKVLDTEPTGEAGQALQTNFVTIADHIETTDTNVGALQTNFGLLVSVVDTKASAASLASKLNITGGTLTGDLSIGNSSHTGAVLRLYDNANDAYGFLSNSDDTLSFYGIDSTLADIQCRYVIATNLTGNGSSITGLTAAQVGTYTTSAIDTLLNAKVSTSTLTTTLSSYVTSTSLTSTLGSYATTSALTSGLAGKANTTHTHAQSDVTGLTAALAAKADATSLSAYLPLTGGSLSGNLTLGNGTSTFATFQAGSGSSLYVDLPNGLTLNGSTSVNGTLYATSVNGGGSGLTGLNASNLASGTVAAGLLPAASTTIQGAMSATDKTKLNGIATGATANQTDAYLLSRTNHTGTQSYTTITGLGTAANVNTGTTSGTIPLLTTGGALSLTGGLTATTATLTGTVTFGNSSVNGGGTLTNGDLVLYGLGFGGVSSLTLKNNSGGTAGVTLSNIGNGTFLGTVTASSFAGSGASLTSLNGSNISTGTINAARLPDLSATYLSTAGGAITGNLSKTNSGTTVTLNLNSYPGFPSADFIYPSGGIFRAAEVSLAGTNDVFFQAVPGSAAGYGYLETYGGAGLIVGTGTDKQQLSD